MANFFSPAPESSRRTQRIDDDPRHAVDELSHDTVPGSPDAATFTTQPTQPIGRTTLGPSKPTQEFSSPSSRSIVEVPASSPFQARPSPPPPKPSAMPVSKPAFASRMAPAGTSFRPPQPPPRGVKRPSAESVEPITIEDSDSDTEKSPIRPEIRPTMFKKHVSSFAYLPIDQLQKRVEEVYDITGGVFPKRLCRQALSACHNNVDDAIIYLQDGKHLNNGKTPEKPKPKDSQKGLSTSHHFGPKPASEKSQSKSQSPAPAKPRRRLIQGRRPNRSPSPVASQAPITIEDDEDELTRNEPIVIQEEKDDDYDNAEDDLGAAVQESLADKGLKTINESSIEDLAAMTSLKVDQLSCIKEKRPFESLASVERVSMPKKGKHGKAAKVAIGETLVEAVMDFTRAVLAIDDVVAECDRKATIVKEDMASWDIDFRGHKKSVSGCQTPNNNDPLLTPRSQRGQKLTSPPIAKQPALMDGHCEMRPFQLYGLNWMSLLHKNRNGCILADEMGLGKTCQVISLITHLVETYDENDGIAERPWPNLVVVPPSTLSNWQAEFTKFAPDLSVLTYQGSMSTRAQIAEEMLEAPEDYHVVLTSYTQVGKEEDLDALIELRPNAAIFDEGHKMKNPKTKIYKDLIRIKANWRMLLTGTPVQNNLLEMLSLLQFIEPRMFKGSMEHLNYMFGTKVTIRDVNNGAFLYGERVSRARNIIEPFILQRRKQQVLSDMPAKTNNVVYCDLPASQQELYNEYEQAFKSGPTKIKRDARQNDQNNVWMQLRKAAIHPQLFRRYFTDKKVRQMAEILMRKVPQSELHQPDMKHLIGELENCSDFELHLWCRDYPCIASFDVPDDSWMESGKVTKLLELLHQYRENGDRVLVFSKFAKVIEILREALFTADIHHTVLYGATGVEERQGLINEFNANTDMTAFLLTTGAGGTGINLTSANKVIIFDQSDNPQDDIQAENRAHRLGQTRDVEVIRLLASGTIEELIYKACSKKIELANKVMGATDESMETGKDAEVTLEREVRKMMELTPP